MALAFDFFKHIHLLIGSVNPSTLILFKAIFDNACPLHLHLNFQINLCKKGSCYFDRGGAEHENPSESIVSEDESVEIFFKRCKSL